jgi:hypothetical protein
MCIERVEIRVIRSGCVVSSEETYLRLDRRARGELATPTVDI